MNVQIEDSWKEVLHDEFEKEYFSRLVEFVHKEYQTRTIFPKGKHIFKSFNLCPFHSVKVVLLGQDPYHGIGQAHGLSFSVPKGITIPPSLHNIFKEINRNIEHPIPNHGNLTRWAKQGVLLLNSILTVRAHQAGSHQGKGWETFTDSVIKILSNKKEHLVFLLWGSFAKSKVLLINHNKHLTLLSAHPSPLSAHRGFNGCAHFSKTNHYLTEKDIQPIDW